MSIEDRLVHTLVIERSSSTTDDAYGQPVQTWGVLATVPGYVEPKSAREVALQSQAGVVVSEHTIYLRAMSPAWIAAFADPALAAEGPIKAADRVRFSPDDGRRFELTGIRRFSVPGHDHLECDARLVADVT